MQLSDDHRHGSRFAKSWLRRSEGEATLTLPCTEVKLPVGDRDRNRRTHERSFRVRDAIVPMNDGKL